jgi:hypothetical protein
MIKLYYVLKKLCILHESQHGWKKNDTVAHQKRARTLWRINNTNFNMPGCVETPWRIENANFNMPGC